MNPAKNATPWVLVLISLLGWGGTWLYQSNQLHQQFAEMQINNAKHEQQQADANRKISELEQKIGALATEANQKLAAANQKYEELSVDANQQIEHVNKQIELASQKIEHESLPEVAATITFRKAVIANGFVAKITNTDSSTIAISAEIERPTTGQRKTFSATLDANKYKEIGGLEGWAFIQGDVITITQGGHKSKTIVVP